MQNTNTPAGLLRHLRSLKREHAELVKAIEKAIAEDRASGGAYQLQNFLSWNAVEAIGHGCSPRTRL